jgi:hypothetical protein
VVTPKQPTVPPAIPSAWPSGTATHAPVKPPSKIRAVRPGSSVRFGVCGSLSATNSTNASTVKIATEGTAPMRDSGRAIFSQPRCTAHAVAAGAVSARNPPNSPMRKAKRSVRPSLPPTHQFSVYDRLKLRCPISKPGRFRISLLFLQHPRLALPKCEHAWLQSFGTAAKSNSLVESCQPRAVIGDEDSE